MNKIIVFSFLSFLFLFCAFMIANSPKKMSKKIKLFFHFLLRNILFFSTCSLLALFFLQKDYQWNLMPDSHFGLAKESKKLLSDAGSLSQLKINFIGPQKLFLENKLIFDELNNQFGIKSFHVDPMKNFSQVSKLGLKEIPSIQIKSGNKSIIREGDVGEEQLVRSLLSFNSEKKYQICYLNKTNYSFVTQAAFGGSHFQSYLESMGATLRAFDLSQVPKCDFYFIWGLKKLNESELQNLRTIFEKEKFLFSYDMNFDFVDEKLNALLKSFGIHPLEGIAIDADEYKETGEQSIIDVMHLGKSLKINLSRSFEIRGKNFEVIHSLNENVWLEKNIDEIETGSSFFGMGDIKGPLNLGVQLNQGYILGSSHFLRNMMRSNPENFQWASKFIQKSMGVKILNLSSRDMTLAHYNFKKLYTLELHWLILFCPFIILIFFCMNIIIEFKKRES